MTPQEQINPELIKKCAEVALPRLEWEFFKWGGVTYVTEKDITPEIGEFNPLKRLKTQHRPNRSAGDDQIALQVALMKEGYHFGRYANGVYYAYRCSGAYLSKGDWWTDRSVRDDSFPLLLLRAASLQFNIQMFVGGGI